MRFPIADPAKTPAKHALRRLAFMIVWLALFDQFVPAILEHLEQRHYETAKFLRFENSDLFGLGPVVSYLREHPHSTRPRAVFIGNSMTFGYLLDSDQTLSAQFEKIRPDMRVFNLAINSQEFGSNYLVTKAIIDSVDVVFAQTSGDAANPILGSLIPIDDGDFMKFHIPRPDPLESRLEAIVGRIWKLYRDHERLQAAMFGTSTRLFIYRHRDRFLRYLKPATPSAPAPASAGTSDRPALRAPRATSANPQAIARMRPLLLDFARLAQAHRRRVVFIEYEYFTPFNDTEIAQFNAAFQPYAEIVIVHVPQSLTIDTEHLTVQGCRLVAELLDRHERERRPQ